MLKDIAGIFHQEKNFANFAKCFHWRNFYLWIFCSVLRITLKMTFTVLAKIYISVMQKIAGICRLGEIFVQQKTSGYKLHNGL